jgi:hypothetical protein
LHEDEFETMVVLNHERDLSNSLNEWFNKDHGPAPFPAGTLLYWRPWNHLDDDIKRMAALCVMQYVARRGHRVILDELHHPEGVAECTNCGAVMAQSDALDWFRGQPGSSDVLGAFHEQCPHPLGFGSSN